jgi:tripartite-type tricarboxylate transporter receptor subunit TctC
MRFALFLLMVFCTGTGAQSYPDRPLRLIVPFPPGGSNDVVGRVIGAQLGERLGQTVIIDNRGDAGGTIGFNAAAKAAPDGYTLLMVSVGYPLSRALGRMPPESTQWFTPVASLGVWPSVLVVPGSPQVNSLQELVALAKRKPGVLNAGSAGPGSFQHLATELFRLRAGIEIVIIQYKGGGPALTDTISGTVHLNVGSAKRIAPLPDVPTFAEQGVTGAEANNWWGIAVPAGTPGPVIARLEREIGAVLEAPETRRRFDLEGAEVLSLGPAQFSDMMARETAKWIRVVREAGIKAE